MKQKSLIVRQGFSENERENFKVYTHRLSHRLLGIAIKRRIGLPSLFLFCAYSLCVSVRVSTLGKWYTKPYHLFFPSVSEMTLSLISELMKRINGKIPKSIMIQL